MFECHLNADLAVCLEARRPELIVQVPIGEGNRLDRVIAAEIAAAFPV
jgi:hypothetical protein